MSQLVSCKNISKTFSSFDHKAIENLDLTVSNGEFIAIMGPSGSGKSTLLNLIGGLLTPDSGEIRFEDRLYSTLSEKELESIRKRNIGFIFQDPYLFQALTAFENIKMISKIAKLDLDDAKIEEALDEFGLAEHKNKLPSQLSLGQKRRVAIVRALITKPELILADEPTNDLDKKWAHYVINTFKQIVKNKESSVIMVTHDERYAKEADIIYYLDDGKLTLVS